ncbi:MAG TPA: hypothetical protein VGL42_07960 [Opitutaceae bacterium]|jgi:hypothetical protein
MNRLTFLARVVAGLGLLAIPGVLRAQFSITVNGQTTTISAAEFAALPHQTVTAFDAHDHQNHAYSGVAAEAVLSRGGVPLGESLRGKRLRQIVIAHTSDNYDIVYALAEFDPAFNPRTILVVDQQDGRPLNPTSAPYRLMIPGDKRPARWARMVTGFEVKTVD